LVANLDIIVVTGCELEVTNLLVPIVVGHSVVVAMIHVEQRDGEHFTILWLFQKFRLAKVTNLSEFNTELTPRKESTLSEFLSSDFGETGRSIVGLPPLRFMGFTLFFGLNLKIVDFMNHVHGVYTIPIDCQVERFYLTRMLFVIKYSMTKTPSEWCSLAHVDIIDPDGWDRQNFTVDWARPISFIEFWNRAGRSTCRGFTELAKMWQTVVINMDVKVETKNFGMTVKATMVNGEVLVFNNVTEVHYCYPSSVSKSLAFESDIHGTGCTYRVELVTEFEVRPATELADQF